MTSTYPQYAGQRFRVWFVELTPPRRTVWEWHPGNIDPDIDYDRESRATVTFELAPSGQGTRLTVSETGFDAIVLARRAKVYEDNSQGWTEVLVWPAAACRSGALTGGWRVPPCSSRRSVTRRG